MLQALKEVASSQKPVARIALLLLTTALASGAIFPDKIGDFERGAPTSLTMPDRALFDEFGLEATEQAAYKSEAKHFTATAWRFKDSTGAMAFFQAHRPSGATPAPLAKLSVATRTARFSLRELCLSVYRRSTGTGRSPAGLRGIVD